MPLAGKLGTTVIRWPYALQSDSRNMRISTFHRLMPQQLLMKKKAVERIVFLKVVWLACITLVIL